MTVKTLTPENYITRRGIMMVLSSPSGAGKTTLAKKLLESNEKMRLSVSHTTRAPRPHEEDGRDYHFCSVEEFEILKEEGGFLETAKVFGNFYGTLKAPVKESLTTGYDVLFDIDWQGTQQLAQKMGERVVSIFVLPPSMIELEKRLHSRSSDSKETIALRMSQAATEISHWAEYDYVIINNCLEESLEQIKKILDVERLRRERQWGLSSFIEALIGEGGEE